MLTELDYRNEAYHMRRLDENMADIEGVRVPDVDGARSAHAGADDGVRPRA